MNLYKYVYYFQISDSAKTKQLEQDFSRQKEENEECLKQIDKRDKRIKILEQSLRAQEKKFQGDLKSRNHTISCLQGELEASSNNVIYLTTELRNIKLKQRYDSSLIISRSEGNPVNEPTPPKDGAPRHRRSAGSYGRRGNILASAGEVRKGSAGSNSSNELDPTPFLRQSNREPKVEMKPSPAVLPPISSGGHQITRRIIVRKVAQSHPIPKTVQLAQNSSPEIETLAVDRMSSNDTTWTRTHGSQSSEYK